tara:strand:+ start:240 stop:485 length:246 start_codon:yes stop_codon:yes gene_type:complete
MTAAPLTIIDSPAQLDGEIGQAWIWEADDIGCPFSTPAELQSAASAAQSREEQPMSDNPILQAFSRPMRALSRNQQLRTEG